MLRMQAGVPPNRFRQLREEASVTVEQIARACDVYGSTVSRWQDAPFIPPQHLPTVAALLGVSVPVLAGWEAAETAA